MANKVGYIIQLQNRFSRNAKKINADMRRIDKNAAKAARTINRKLSGSMKGLGRTAKNALGAVIAAFSIRELIRRGADFQDKMADLQAITGATGKDFSKLTEETFRLSKAWATSQSDVATGIKLVASAKPELLENLGLLIKTTEQVLLLKNAAGIDLVEASEVVAQSLNIFGESAESASRFVNVLAAGAKFGSSEIRDTGQAILIAGGAAVNAGLSFEQLNAIIQATAKGGFKGARAGTALQAILGRLRRQGIDFQKIGLEGSFQAVKDALDSVTDSTARALLEAKIFGEEHGKVGFAILSQIPLLSKLERKITGTKAAQEQANIRLATFNTKLRRLGVIITDKIIKTFNRLEPVLSKNIERFGEFLDTISPDQIDAMGRSLAGLVEVLAILGKAFVIPLSLLKGIGTAIGELVAQFATLNFGANISTSFADAFSIGGKLFGVLERDKGGTAQNLNTVTQRSQTDVNVNLLAPEKTVASVKTRTSGKTPGLNVGVNLAEAL